MKSVSIPLWFVWLTVIGSVVGAINGMCFIWTNHELKEERRIVHDICNELRYGYRTNYYAFDPIHGWVPSVDASNFFNQK